MARHARGGRGVRRGVRRGRCGSRHRERRAGRCTELRCRSLVLAGGFARGRLLLELDRHRLREAPRLLAIHLEIETGLIGTVLRRRCGLRAVRAGRSRHLQALLGLDRSGARRRARQVGGRPLVRRRFRGHVSRTRGRQLHHGAAADSEDAAALEGSGVEDDGIAAKIRLHGGQRFGHRPGAVGLQLESGLGGRIANGGVPARGFLPLLPLRPLRIVLLA